MRRGRQRVVWLALAAVVLYGLAPAGALAALRSGAPAACDARAEHACACQAAPGAAGACCCAPGAASCRLGSAPCGGSPSVGSVLWTAAHPLSFPAPAGLAPAPSANGRSFPAGGPSLRVVT